MMVLDPERGNEQHALKIFPMEIPTKKFRQFSDSVEIDDGLKVARQSSKTKKLQED